MTLQDVGVRISEDLRIAPELFGFHLYSRLEHVFVKKDDYLALLESLVQWLDPNDSRHEAFVLELVKYMNLSLVEQSGGALDE
jgi:hypothetical protein